MQGIFVYIHATKLWLN